MRRKSRLETKKKIKQQILFIAEGESEINIINYIKKNLKLRYIKIVFVLLKEVRLSTKEPKKCVEKLLKCIKNYSKNGTVNFSKIIIWIDSDRFSKNIKEYLSNFFKNYSNVKIYWSEPNLESNYKHCKYLSNQNNKPYLNLESRSNIEHILKNENIKKIIEDINF